MYLTIVLPTYNEAENLPRLVSALFALPLENLHLLVVDDNSPDGTGALAEQMAAERPDSIEVLHRSGKLGLGTAYVMGFQHALQSNAGMIAQMDCDFSHPPERLPAMVAALAQADFVIGSRYVPGGSVDNDWPLWRKGLSAWGNFYARTLLGMPIRDTTGGYRVWRRETLQALPLDRLRARGYAFMIELNYVAYRLGFRPVEIPIYFADRRWGQSKMSFSIQREAAVRVLQLRAAYRDLKPLA